VAEPTVRPFGSWPSPIIASRLVESAAGVGEVRCDGADIWWAETRPGEGGRTQLVRCRAAGDQQPDEPLDRQLDRQDVLPDGWNVRTQVHEYGGGAWAVRSGTTVFSRWDDQRMYRFDLEAMDEPEPLTPEPSTPKGLRYADPCWLDAGWLVAVRESHEPDAMHEHGEAVNELVAVPLDGSAVHDPTRIVVLVSGPDFVASPRACEHRIVWIQWDHPNMPWDGTELRSATIARDGVGAPTGLSDVRSVAGGASANADESVVQPEFAPDGSLLFSSDRSGWWNLWRETADDTADDSADDSVAVSPVDAEIGGPQWMFGGRWFAPADPTADSGPRRIVAAIARNGLTGLCVIETDGRRIDVESPLTALEQVVATEDGTGDVVIVGATPITELAPIRCRFAADNTLELTPLRSQRNLEKQYGIGPAWFSSPEAIDFPSTDGRVSHALWYPPTGPSSVGPANDLPPLLVLSHGGPTSAARARLDLSRQFWTSRGFAVVDVNYGGSTGYGRPYRRLLDGRWGLVDVEDCIAAARHLVDLGRVDPHRLAIRGGSAGGFTTLAALTFHDTFAAGASHYGVADLEALALETHKFESRYLDGLVGPYPEDRDTYVARSPIHHTEQLSCPVILFQGLEDQVVPPGQAEMMIDALAAKGVPHAYVPFEGEQHGFRRSENIVRALEAELWFYGKVFGFTPADPIEPVQGAIGL